MRSRIVFSLFIAFTGFAISVCGDEPPLKDAYLQASEKKSDPGKEPAKRDPTVPSKKLDEILNPPKAVGSTGKAISPALPKVALKGRVIGPNRGPAAILEVDGQLKMVNEGAEISADSGLTIRVIEVNRQRIRVEVMQLKQVMTLP